MSVLRDIGIAAFGVVGDAGPWLIASFVLAGLMHEFVRPERLQRALGNTRPSSLVKATVSGMFLPICSCGVIPLGLGLYYSGAYLGPTLSFMAATPIINPAAVLLAYGMLGPQLATIYLVAGFVIPFFIGVIGNTVGGPELYRVRLDNAQTVVLAAPRQSPTERVRSGLAYGFGDLGLTVSKYVLIGAIMAGAISVLVPVSVIDRYLGDPGMISILSVTVLAALMYVCAVGHIPFIAALLAMGASPGVAITFLMAGAATNLPELVSISKMMGKRSAVIYATTVVGAGLAVGQLANVLIGDSFAPVLDVRAETGTLAAANWLVVAVPEWVQSASALAIIALAVFAYRSRGAEFMKWLRRPREEAA